MVVKQFNLINLKNKGHFCYRHWLERFPMYCDQNTHNREVSMKQIYKFTFCLLLIAVGIFSGCNEDQEDGNEELWAKLTEIQNELDRLNTNIATKDELKSEIAWLQVKLDELNSTISAMEESVREESAKNESSKEEMDLKNAQLMQEIAKLQNKIAELESTISAYPSKEILYPKDNSVMVLIPAGEFIMGTSDSQFEEITKEKASHKITFKHEQPQHTVYLDSFYMDKYEVTNTQFEKFVKETGYLTDAEKEGWGYVWEGTNVWPRISGANWRTPLGPGSTIRDRMNHPVIQVSYNDAVAYANWAGKRLPTEAEWEKSARGDTDDRLFPWGNEWDPGKLNSIGTGPLTTMPVGSFPSGVSPYGLHDMVGNVWEWVADWYHPHYYQNSINIPNPKGPTSGVHRVLRGACYRNNHNVARCSHRDNYVSVPDFRTQLGGFRCAKDVSP